MQALRGGDLLTNRPSTIGWPDQLFTRCTNFADISPNCELLVSSGSVLDVFNGVGSCMIVIAVRHRAGSICNLWGASPPLL